MINTKDLSTLPCAFIAWSESQQKDVLVKKAHVDCNRDCKRCGFSADEQARRLEQGRWVSRGPIRTLMFKAAKA